MHNKLLELSMNNLADEDGDIANSARTVRLF